MKNSFIVNFILFVTVFFTSFFFCSKTLFGADITSAPLNPDYAQWLKENMFGNGSSSSGSIPSGSAIIEGYAPQLSPYLLDQINQDLYDTYGYDLNDAYSDVAMSILDYDETSSERVQLLQTLTGGLYDNFSALVSAGLTLGKVGFDNTYGQLNNFFDTYVVGAYDEVSGNITQAFDNVVYKVKDDWTTFWNEYVNHDLFNLSNHGIILTDDYSDIVGSSSLTVHFNNSLILCTDSNNVLYCCGPSSFFTSSSVAGYDLSFSGSGVFVRRGVPKVIDGFLLDNYSSFVVNGVSYTYGVLVYHLDTNITGVWTNSSALSNISRLQDFISAYSPYGSNGVSLNYVYNISSSDSTVDLDSILSALAGQYITSADLSRLIDIIGESKITIVDDDSSTAVLDPTLVAELEGLITSINELSLSLEGEIDTMPPFVDPTPPTDPDTPTLTPLPDGYFPPIIPSLLPSEMFEMFQPVFDIVGGDNSMYGVWLLIPSILIATLILYLIVSLF